jgi:adenylyltransferase/sulfurtransferase
MPTLRIPTPLRPYTAGASELAVHGSTVAEVLTDLTARHPDLRQHIFTETGELRAFVNLFVNDEDVRFLDGAETLLQEDDRLMILPSIAGG